MQPSISKYVKGLKFKPPSKTDAINIYLTNARREETEVSILRYVCLFFHPSLTVALLMFNTSQTKKVTL